jgi:hypothetical protein
LLIVVGGSPYVGHADLPSSQSGRTATVALAPRTDAVRRWNQVAVDATGIDHAQSAGTLYGYQLGPTRASRAMAIVHIAMADTVNAIAGGWRSYTDLPRARDPVSMDAAVATAAHDALAALYPAQASRFDAFLVEDLNRVRPGALRENGVALGQRAARAILAMRSGDGSERPEPHVGVDWTTNPLPGHWQVDPISKDTIALGAYWGDVKPFAMQRGDQFRVPPPPSLTDPAYTATFDYEKGIGGDGVTTPTVRTPEETEIGIYWAYDGTPSLCAPPRMYNQIAVQLADMRGIGTVELARYLALVNVAMADAAIAVWESKFFYDFWRPVTAIRGAAGDGNPNTGAITDFSPLGAPASNADGPNFTPPFPSYPSGHAGFGGAVFQVLREYFGTDEIPFTFVSDELNGVTVDNQGNQRPLLPRSFTSLTQAEDENGQSRLYLGIHWEFDKDFGIAQGREVGSHVMRNLFQPVR